MSRLSHNKKRNVGLVYELLTREVAKATLDKSPKAARRAAEALDIISKHLGPGSVLEEELGIHLAVMEARGSQAALARRIVDELRAAGLRLTSSQVIREKAKTELIHEINRRLGQSAFDNRVSDYTAHASVGILLGRGLGRLDEGVELARVEEHLVSFLASKGTVSGLNPDATLHTYQTALRIFEEEYGANLTADQSALLKEQVKMSLGGPREPMDRLFNKQTKSLKARLTSALDEQVFRDDVNMTAALKEAIEELSTPFPATDASVERLMLFHNLVREIDSK